MEHLTAVLLEGRNQDTHGLAFIVAIKNKVFGMKYTTGEEVRIGDQVLIENGKTEGCVRSIIETSVQMREWGVDELGVLIESAPFGLVFWPASEIEDPIIFKERLRHV